MAETTSCESLQQMLSLVEMALASRSLPECCQDILPPILALAEADRGFVFVSDPRLPSESFTSRGFLEEQLDLIERERAAWLGQRTDTSGALPVTVHLDSIPLNLFPLHAHERTLGMIGVAGEMKASTATGWPQLLTPLGAIIEGLASAASMERRQRQDKAFREISSLLARPAGLSESLELALFSVASAISAEAASILLLDAKKETFQFTHSVGSAKPRLGETTFAATDGIAGRVLQTLEPEIVNDVEADPRFTGRVDSETGFKTRSLIAVPLFVGNEPIGVLEVLNSTSGRGFTPEDRLLLVSLLDPIAFAIRNATAFDRLAVAYCKRRQRQDSCEGCPLPLDAWSPCVEYREALS